MMGQPLISTQQMCLVSGLPLDSVHVAMCYGCPFARLKCHQHPQPCTLQSIDSMQGSHSMDHSEHLRLRGGAGGRKKTEGSSSKKAKVAQEDAVPAIGQSQRHAAQAETSQAGTEPADPGKPLPHHFAVGDSIEASTFWPWVVPCCFLLACLLTKQTTECAVMLH